MASDRLFDRACNDLQAQTKKVLELKKMNNALLARVARLEDALRSITKLEHTATPGQMREIARRALEEK